MKKFKGYDVEKDIEFWNMAGYDFIRITPRYEFPKSWLNHPEARLSTLEEYEKYPWPTCWHSWTHQSRTWCAKCDTGESINEFGN